jgi:threonine/homoserine/homoserine lactone efflux protein
VLYTLAAGLSRLSRASLVVALGCSLGMVPHLVAAITGLAALQHESAVASQTLNHLGVAYLLYMAWMTLHDKGALVMEKDTTSRSAGGALPIRSLRAVQPLRNEWLRWSGVPDMLTCNRRLR